MHIRQVRTESLRQCRPTSLQRSVCRYAQQGSDKGLMVTCIETGGQFQATLVWRPGADRQRRFLQVAVRLRTGSFRGTAMSWG
ncbi:hypothetical protein KCP71_06210 [Salmonella enterica subsp. enterica]|nr:hypothetical protein KCP71_06210 [Salmonella enterica subsp. enterica]